MLKQRARRKTTAVRTVVSETRAGYASDSCKTAFDFQTSTMSDAPADLPDFAKGGGLLPAVAQDADTGEVLMLAYMNAESFARTIATGEAVYFSRSRKRLWRKGEESGHTQQVCSIFVDCDGDTILLKVHQRGGAACHEGYRSCFFRELTPTGPKVIGERVFNPQEIYE